MFYFFWIEDKLFKGSGLEYVYDLLFNFYNYKN